MTSMQKRKGSQWERDAAEILNKLVKKSLFRRVAGSGALGTIMFEPSLSADVKGKVESIPQEFKIECKVGYGGATQFALKKEWLDKIKEEAARSYGIPMLMGKFSGAREGIRHFVVLDVEVFASLINRITELQYEIDNFRKIPDEL
jgi:Holliday junction resolvase